MTLQQVGASSSTHFPWSNVDMSRLIEPPLDTLSSGNAHFCQKCGLGGIAWVGSGCKMGLSEAQEKRGQIGKRVPSPIPPSHFGGPDGWYGSLVSGTDHQSWQDSPLGTEMPPSSGGHWGGTACASACKISMSP